MRRVRAFARLAYRRTGAKCLWRGHRPRRTRLAFACRDCRLSAAGLSDFGLMDGGDYINPLRTRFDRRHGSVERSAYHEEPVSHWRSF